jgi:CarD family transcriptional regulator, regulator of rRNA transcription
MTFKVGDKAVYPAHGVGIIEGVETREIAGTKQTFYVLKIMENGMTIMVPTRNADNIGMREVIAADKIDQVYDILKERDVHLDTQTWNRRYREYMGKIKTGSVFEVAKVLRDLSILKTDKSLSFGERKMFDIAKSLLVKELAVALKETEEQVEDKISVMFD